MVANSCGRNSQYSQERKYLLISWTNKPGILITKPLLYKKFQLKTPQKNSLSTHGPWSPPPIDHLGIPILDPLEALFQGPFDLPFNGVHLVASNPLLPLKLRVTQTPRRF